MTTPAQRRIDMQAHRQAGRRDALVPGDWAVAGPARRYPGNPRMQPGQHSPRPGSMTSGRKSGPVRLSTGAGG
jgi:hypothetical protein